MTISNHCFPCFLKSILSVWGCRTKTDREDFHYCCGSAKSIGRLEAMSPYQKVTSYAVVSGLTC